MMVENECLPTAAKVTVIIPAYNREKYISMTVDSVLNQTYTNVELIVVDDGSSDRTFSILQGYGNRITLLQHEGGVNKGQSAAINLGIKSSKSKYIAILDSDDLFLSHKLEKQVTFLEAHPDIGLVYGNGYYIDEDGDQLYPFFQEDHVETSDPERVLLDCYLPLPTNTLIRRSIYEEVGIFDESLRSGQDHDMLLRVAEATKFAYIDDFIFCYRIHEDTISKKHTGLRWRNGFLILDKAVKRYSYSSSTIRKRKAVLHFHLGQCLLKEHRNISALFHFVIAGSLDPVRGLKVCCGL